MAQDRTEQNNTEQSENIQRILREHSPHLRSLPSSAGRDFNVVIAGLNCRFKVGQAMMEFGSCSLGLQCPKPQTGSHLLQFYAVLYIYMPYVDATLQYVHAIAKHCMDAGCELTLM